jgi:sorbitol-specific phosphotransferase system component IIBC
MPSDPAHKATLPLAPVGGSPPPDGCAKSAKSAKSPPSAPLNALFALNAQCAGDDAPGGVTTGGPSVSAPLNALFALNAQCGHAQTRQADGQTVCVGCGEMLSESPQDGAGHEEVF